MKGESRAPVLGAVLFLIAGVCVIFLNPAEQYFFGDSISVLWGRPESWGALLRDFTRLDGTFWFRPLSNSLPPFLLWPLFGMNFWPYHAVAVALHCVVVLGLFAIFRRIFADTLAAFSGAAFFAFHPIQFYATYDIAFYQEPISTGLALVALLLMGRYAAGRGAASLLLGLFCFGLALCSKETSLVLPGPLALVLCDRLVRRERRALVAVAAKTGLSLAATYFYLGIAGLLFREQTDYRPQWHTQVLTNAWDALHWAFGLSSGWQTQGWHYPAVLRALLWGTFLGCLMAAVLLPRRGLWRGLVWFLGTGLLAFSTNHLLPHHLYFPLIGISFLFGGAVAWLRAGSHETAPRWPRWLGSAAPAAALSALIAAALLAVRADSLDSWVGRSSWETRAVAQFFHTSRLRLADARGVVVWTGTAPYLTFDWMDDDIFQLLGGYDLEVRHLKERPEQIPEGFYALEYRDHWLWNRTAEFPRSAAGPSPRAARAAPFKLRLEPSRVRPGADSYSLEVPELGGQLIDLKYRFNQRAPRVAFGFVQLDGQGRARIAVPASIPWGTVDVVAVRRAGSLDWHPVQASIEVLP